MDFQHNLAGKKGRSASNSQVAWLLLSIACVLWGIGWHWAKQTIHYIPVLQLAAMRQLLCGIGYLAYLAITGQWQWPSQWAQLLVAALFQCLLGDTLAIGSLAYLPASLAAVLYALMPLWLVVNGLLFGTGKVSAKALIGFGIGLAGLALILFAYRTNLVHGGFLFGLLIALLATFSSAWAWTLYRTQNKGGDSLHHIGWQLLIAGFVLYGLSRFSGIAIPLPRIQPAAWLSFFNLVFFGSLMAFILYVYALKKLGLKQASMQVYLSPLVALLAGTLGFQENLSTMVFTGALVLLFGIYLVNTDTGKR